MTTQELKSYIDRMLGNSIRLLLPSYWWKRAFGAVIDNTISKDEVKTINGESIVGEGNLKVGVTTVGSIDELNALEASVGDIATVGEESTMLVRAGDLPQVDVPNEILEKWDSLTRIVKVEFGEPVTENGHQATVYLNGKKPYVYDTILIASSEGGFFCAHIVAGEIKEITIEEVNERLKKHDYRFMMGSTGDVSDRAFKLHAYSASANAYIKSDSWEKLSREYVVSSEEELNALSVENGTIAKVAYDYEVRSYRNTKISNSTDKDFDRVVGLDVLSVPSSSFEITIYAQELEANNKSLSVTCYGTGRIDGVIRRREGNVSYQEEVYNLAFDYSIKADGIKRFNELLRSMDCLLVHNSYVSEEFYALIDSVLRFHIAVPVVSNAYIKGETWERLAKEGENSAIIIYADETSKRNADAFYKIKELHENGQPATNVVVVDGVAYAAAVSYGELMESGVYVVMAQYAPIETSQRVTITPRVLMMGISKDSGEGEAAAKIILRAEIGIVDSELSDTSTNAVQNKVITAALGNKADKSDIKTINGVSLLGGGDITISGGGVSEDYVNTAIANAITTTLNTAV